MEIILKKQVGIGHGLLNMIPATGLECAVWSSPKYVNATPSVGNNATG